MTSSDFLVKYPIPYELEKQSLAGVKLLPVENGSACQFMTEEGCSVYEDRPTACRYYPVALLSMRKQNEYTEREAYAMVKEEHCLGHFEPRTITINEYRKEQGVEEYDEHGKGWRQLVLKKKSSGPSIGNPRKRSLQLFFMACYDIDNFRKFVMSDSFNEVYDLSEEIKAQLQNDEIVLMNFGFQLIRHVMFNEPSIPMKTDALDKRMARKKMHLRLKLTQMLEDLQKQNAMQPEPREAPPAIDVKEHQEKSGELPSFDITLDDAPVAPPEGVKQLLTSVYLDFGEIPPEYLVPAGDGFRNLSYRTFFAAMLPYSLIKTHALQSQFR